MLFNSFVFWVFFALVIISYSLLKHKWQNRLLLLASYVFYGWWDWRFLSLIFISTIVDYFAAIHITSTDKVSRKKLYCIISICVNLGILGFFKYFNFFSEGLIDTFNAFGWNLSLPTLKVILPVGISFYTFQTMSYTIDVYRGVTNPERNFLDFALYVCFFPQLVAGPIERSSHLLPQVINERKRKGEDFAYGMYLVMIGLFKKVVIADNMAPIVDTIFKMNSSELTGGLCLAGMYAFAFQIYGDFSGYSAIARGVAKWLGFDLMVNFRHPYFAVSPSDFWRRWHISLSTWLRDYLYIPLGGNRRGKFRTYRNLMITMLLGGLWHGAAWTFVIWGFYHGVILIIYRLGTGVFSSLKLNAKSIPMRIIGMILMFHLVCVGFLIFRAETFNQAFMMLTKIFTDMVFPEFAVFCLASIAFFVTPILVLEIWNEWSNDLLRLTKSHWLFRGLVYSYATFMLIIFQPIFNQEFIYFQF